MEQLSWTELRPNPLNELVRGVIDEVELEELADSIQEHGVIEPLVVVPPPPQGEGGKYLIVSGERRWRAAQLLGENAPTLPCVVREPMGELDQLLVMGVENLQRHDLGPIGEARYFDELRRRGLSIEETVRRTGCNRARVERGLRLLKLHADVQAMMARGIIPVTVERDLARLELDEQVELCAKMRGRSRAAIKRATKIVMERKERATAAQIAGGRRNGKRPAVETVVERVSGAELELAVRATCAACEAYVEMRHDLAWDEVRQALDGQCERCEVREIKEACGLCPLVDFLRVLKTLTEGRGVPVGPAHLYEREILNVNGKH